MLKKEKIYVLQGKTNKTTNGSLLSATWFDLFIVRSRSNDSDH